MHERDGCLQGNGEVEQAGGGEERLVVSVSLAAEV